jgi:hypothetical protein
MRFFTLAKSLFLFFYCFFIYCLFVFAGAVSAMPTKSATDSLPSAYRALYWGVEQEVAPYILRGWSLGGWIGLGRARLRAATVRLDMPNFIRSRYLSQERVIANSIAVDFFLKPEFKGFYFGGGGGYWTTILSPKPEFGQQKRRVESLMFSGGCGYNFLIWKGLYISPWVALHTRITGNAAVDLGSATYNPRLIFPEIALKIGWKIGQGQ